jgi:hypothetical protein
MNLRKTLGPVFLVVLSLGCLSLDPGAFVGNRKIACVQRNVNFLPLEGQLFSNIADEATQKDAMSIYFNLLQAEYQAVANVNGIRQVYGLAPVSPFPTANMYSFVSPAPFNPATSPVTLGASGFLWGDFSHPETLFSTVAVPPGLQQPSPAVLPAPVMGSQPVQRPVAAGTAPAPASLLLTANQPGSFLSVANPAAVRFTVGSGSSILP